MDNLKNILSRLKDKGYRFSACRNNILNFLLKSQKPLAVSDFQKLFELNKYPVNRTTLYRELKVLKKEGLITEMQLKDSKSWYELAQQGHHHHLVCIKCNKIKKVDGCDGKLSTKILKQSPDFAKIQGHTFVFFGLCKLCIK